MIDYERIIRLEQAVGKLASLTCSLSRYIGAQYHHSALTQAAVYAIGDEAAEIARQFTGEPEHEPR